MKVKLLKPCAYCSGVSHAFMTALKARHETPRTKPVYIIGMLVHNDSVISELSDAGLTSLYGSSYEQLLNSIPNKSTVVFTAHGHSVALDKIASEKHLTVYDAVCDKVQNNLTLIKKELEKNKQVIYIGYKNHPETEAALSLSKNVLLYDMNYGFDFLNVKTKNPIVINQTTLNYKSLEEIHALLKKNIPGVRILDEICDATRLRQEAINNLDENVDAIVIVGNVKSSNSKRLLEIAQESHKDAYSCLISNVNELNLDLFKDKKSVVVTSGTSTPKSDIDAIINILETI